MTDNNIAMAAKDFDLDVMLQANSPDLQRAAALAYGEKKFLSGIVLFLPTKGLDETEKLFKHGIEDLLRDSQIFAKFIHSGEADGEARSVALHWKNADDMIIETGRELADQTRGIPIDKNGNPKSDLIDLDDGLELGTDPNIKASAAVRGPFLYFPYHRACRENNFSQAVDCGGCATVIKEFRGLQLRRVLRRITKVIEPWFSRRRIIYQWVWVLEWVPVEVIKTITAKCCCDHERPHISKQVVLDRELINFWRCL
jgi:hypothetical protein